MATTPNEPRWRNWQTRQLEVLVGVISRGGSSPLLGIEAKPPIHEDRRTIATKNAHGPNPWAYLLSSAWRLLPSAFFLAPISKKDKKIFRPDSAVAVDIGEAIIAIGTWAPFAEQDQQVLDTDRSVAV